MRATTSRSSGLFITSFFGRLCCCEVLAGLIQQNRPGGSKSEEMKEKAIMPKACCEARPIIIVGSPRSGTTLLRLMWNAHPGVIMPHECPFMYELYPKYASVDHLTKTHIDQFLDDLFLVKDCAVLKLDRDSLLERLISLENPDYAHVIDAVYREFASRHGKHDARWGDKHTQFIMHMPEIISLFPNARFIHIVRDGRAVVSSMLKTKLGTYKLPNGRAYNSNQPISAAKLWAYSVQLGSAEGARMGPEKYLEIKYENLILEPETVCKNMCHFVGEAFSEAMLDTQSRKECSFIPQHKQARWHTNIGKDLVKSRVNRWREELDRHNIVVVEYLAGRVLDRYGYERIISKRRLLESARLLISIVLHTPLEVYRRMKRRVCLMLQS